MLRTYLMQQRFKLSDPAMEEALHDVPVFRDFVGLSHGDEPLPSQSSFLRLAIVNALLPAKGLQLKAGVVVDATRIAEPSSTKNQSGERDPEIGHVKVCYRELKKNTAQTVTLCALGNLWIAQHKLLAMGPVHVQGTSGLQDLGQMATRSARRGSGCPLRPKRARSP